MPLTSHLAFAGHGSFKELPDDLGHCVRRFFAGGFGEPEPGRLAFCKLALPFCSGITLQSAALRRRPNAFNLWHQLLFEKKLNRLPDGSLQAL